MKFRSILILFSISLLLAACSLAEDITPPPDYQSPTPQPTLGALFPANPPDLVAGAAIFVEKCAPCHGSLGLGDGPTAANLPNPPSALGKPEIAGVAVPAQWYTVVTQGNINSFMPPFDSLTQQDRWNVVAYALSLSTTPQQLAQGQAIYQANCVNCHGPDGKRSAKSDFTDQVLMSALSQNDLINFINSGTGTTAMPGFDSKLSQDERSAVAAYLRTFTFAPAQVASASTPAPVATVAGTTPTATTTGPVQTAVATQSASASGTPAVIIGSISGKVTNGSTGTLPVGLKAVLHIFQHDTTNNQFTEVAGQEAPLGADGTYAFADLSMPTSQAFYVSVDYAGTTYSSDPATPTQGQSAYDLPIVIYNTTTDASGLVVDQVHILLDYSKPDVIQAVEYYIISNPGTKTVIAKNTGDSIVTVSLPKGYTNLQFQDGQLGVRYLQTADGFGDTSPVVPGKQQYQLVFAFDLPYSSSFEFTQPFSLNISAITFLVSEGVTVTGQNLTDGGLKDMGNGGGKFQLYAAGSRNVGESLTVTVSGKGAQASVFSLPGGDLGRYLIIGLGALGFLLVLGAGWLYLRERKRAPKTEMSGAEDNEALNTDEILDAIIALDDQHTAGNISVEAYQQRRAELKAKLQGKL
jgi:mono/diheme cytochrome c family protein